MNIKAVLIGFGILGLAVAASASPNAQPPTSAKTETQSQLPLLINQFLSGHTWVYYKNRNRYHGLAYKDHIRIYNKFTAVSFTNTASQPIQKITFDFAAYNDSYRPVLGASGQPVVKQLVATGPFAPGVKQTLVNANVVWSIPPGNGLACVRLNGVQIDYADGSSTTVSAAEVGQYFPPQLVNHCGVPPHNRPGVQSRWVGPSPYIAGVYPAKWMILHDRHELYRQPYVPPSDRQPLCAVGSFLEETCVHASNTSSAQDAL